MTTRAITISASAYFNDVLFPIFKKNVFSVFAASILGAIIFPQQVCASVVANFDGGNSTTVVDGYTGMAGLGWGSAWTLSADSSASSVLGTVSSSTPLQTGSGNYLKISFTSSGSSASTSRIRASRLYTDSGEINSSLAAQYSFVLNMGTTTDSQYYIFDAINTVYTGPGGECTWTVLIANGQLQCFLGNRSGGGAYTSTGVTLAENTSYSFIVTADPTTQSWTLQVYNASGGNALFDSTTNSTFQNMGFRRNITTLGGYFSFGVADATPNATANSYTMSIDSIAITQIPEPKVAVVLLLGSFILVSWRILKTHSFKSLNE